MTIYDITLPIEDRMVTWPGDPDVTVERVLDVEKGDPATVSQLRLGSHTGTHVDAFSHFKKGGKTLDQMDLDIYVGKALLVDVGDVDRITRNVLQRLDLQGAERVLFRTRNSDIAWSNQPFNTTFVHLTPDAAKYLTDLGIKLVGIDYLSVEGYHEEDAPAHHQLMDHGVYIVEGLFLKNVPPGWYELICLPLKIKNGDGAPARVILRTLDR